MQMEQLLLHGFFNMARIGFSLLALAGIFGLYYLLNIRDINTYSLENAAIWIRYLIDYTL